MSGIYRPTDQQESRQDQRGEAERLPEAYPAAIESLSNKWRKAQASNEKATGGNFLQRNSTFLGVGIGVAIVIFLIAIGGFLLLIWTVNR